MDISGYWDDFPERVQETANAILEGRNPMLSRLTVHVTESCNLKCSYCNTHQSSEQLDYFDVASIALGLHACNPKATIHFTGGEPTVNRDIEDILEVCKDIGLTTSMNTNCVKKINVSNVDKLKVSLDTLDINLQERLQGKRNLQLIHENLLAYSEEMRGKVLSITALVSGDTFRDMPYFAEKAIRNYHPHNIYFTAYKGTNPDFCLTEEQIEELFGESIPKTLEVFKKYKQEYSYKQLEMYKKHHFAPNNRFPEQEKIPCYIQMTEMVIDPRGRCHDCSHLYRDHVSIPSTIKYLNYGYLKYAFEDLKYKSVSIPMSPHCITGCNPNLVAFNLAVHDKLRTSCMSKK